MKITPLEIRQKTFEKQMRGYDKDEVDAYLQALSFEWERLNNESRELISKLDFASKDVEKLREVESSLYKALKTAEDTGVNIVDQANKTASLHLKETQMDAEALMNEAKSQAKNMVEEAEEVVKSAVDQVKYELQQLEQDYKLLENQRDNLLSDLKAIANESLEKAKRYQDRFSSAKFVLPKIEVNTSNSFTSSKPGTTVTPDVSKETPLDDTSSEDNITTEDIGDEITSLEFEVNTSYPEEIEEKNDDRVALPEDETKKTESDSDEEQSSFFDQI